ncbi:MAG: ABC transporter permease [Longimicrobiales bacterium]|nr:ABC transporter permease [Longimicrobiales bacterium]
MTLDPQDRRLEDEMAHHLEELEEHLRAGGMSAEEARVEARRRFGDPERHARETPRRPDSTWRSRWEVVRHDLVHAVRQMIRHPLTSGLTVTTLALGAAAATVVFSLVHAVVLAPLPFADPHSVVHVSQTSPQGRIYSISEPNFVDFRDRQRSFTEMAAMGWETPILTELGDPVSIEARRVSHTFFPILGIPPLLGRGFLPEEDRFGGATDVALLSEGTWRRRFGADSAVAGRTLTLDGRPRRIVGVVPSDQAWPGVEVFLPLAPNPDLYRDDQRIEAVARLAPGVTLEEAREDMAAIASQLSGEYPESNDGWGAAVRPARDWLIGNRLMRLGMLLLGAVALFLLMTCASVSNLMLARASARIREMSVRSALGAGRSRIASQLLAEGSVVAGVGTLIALLLSVQGLRLAKAFGPGDIARLGEASLNGGALLVALAAVILAVGLGGLAPAILLTRQDRHALLRSGSRAGWSEGRRLRSALVVVQFALAVTVTTGAGLLTRSFMELHDVELGFDAESVVRYAVRLPADTFDEHDQVDYVERLRAELLAIPGVEGMGATTAPPLSPMRPSNFVARADLEPDRQEDFQPVSWRAVTPGYFRAAGIPLLSGRVFEHDDLGARGEQRQNPPVIIDHALAELLFPGEDPVGRLVTWFLPGGQRCEIIGVVAAARDERLDVEARPRIYRPFTFGAWAQPSVLVRTEGDPEALIPRIRDGTLRVDPSIPAIAPTVLSQDVRRSVAWPRFSMQVLSLFGLVALVLAALGIYGVTAFSVSRRRHEIAVRIAMGARPAGVHWMVFRKAMTLALAGIALGVTGALMLAGFLGTLLYEVSEADPITFLTVPLVTLLVAVVSTWIPARQALGLQLAEE